MIAEIELYKGRRRTYYGRLVLQQVLFEALNDAHPGLLPRAEDVEKSERSERPRFVLHFHDAEDTGRIPGEPEVTNVRADFGHLDLRVLVGGAVVHERHYSVSELLGDVLAKLLSRIDPDERVWGFAIRHPALGAMARSRRAPEVEGAVDIDLKETRNLPFTVQRIEERQDAVDPASLGISPGRLGPINVIMSEEVCDLLAEGLPLSTSIEEGGFLLGRLSPAAGAPDRLMVEVTHVTPAERSGASATHFTFTGDSFTAVNRLIVERGQGEDLVGWYHTHLFSAAVAMSTGTGLSGTDVDLHFATFRRPGQVAGLINLHEDTRLVRFYGRVGDRMAECGVWSRDERGRYSMRRDALGRHRGGDPPRRAGTR
ncbi:hypothetical protein SAMN05421505_10827 [Sinosporangium album]|uniref:JAB-N domain-containing protein n=1 Tax=Sinosporangium album TaxID=504805 RepID=A0A1G7X3Y9_9ACTN|nr:JAB N-terminal domain-containing protein [Sinosporangium album]SDG78894.1 hypothetical protein SAMN05421505_10827 [Sinosporangium album]